MKDKLLITIGDSWTEGLGAYGPGALEQYHKDRDLIRLQTASSAWMAAHSWPRLLADKLDCDLLNLGVRGSANSAHAKWLMDQVVDTAYKQVQVVWLLSDPFRFSFYSTESPYSSNSILNVSPIGLAHNRVNRGPVFKELAENYLSIVDTQGVIKETEFYIRVVENYCELKGYELLIGNAFTPIEFKSLHNLHNDQTYGSMQEFLGDDPAMASEVCAHPSELGYNKIAEELARIIEETAKRPRQKFQ